VTPEKSRSFPGGASPEMRSWAGKGDNLRVLVTGGAGFIGSNLVRTLLVNRPGWEIVNLDLLTYAGSLENLSDVEGDSRYHLREGDISSRNDVRSVLDGVDLVINLAAESHVDRSIAWDEPFIRTNVLGTQVLLSEARAAGVSRFVQVGTDEVYGSLPWLDPGPASPGREGPGEPRPGSDGRNPAPDGFVEDMALTPSSPYAASKAAADLIAMSYHTTFGSADDGGLDVVVVRSSNVYGPRQHGEKLIPTLVRSALAGRALPLYGDGLHIRDWLHVGDMCAGLLRAAERGAPGRIYNLGGAGERTNRQVARQVLSLLAMDCAPRIGSEVDRPGHDRRYSMNFARARAELGWAPQVAFQEGLSDTVRWFLDNPRRLDPGPDPLQPEKDR
jgi:dTDP-glucose 4,6-dehydratase